MSNADVIRSYIKKYRDILIPEHNYVSIIVEFDDMSTAPYKAFCDFDNYEDHFYVLWLDQNLSGQELEKTIAHEMVHVKQHIDGKLSVNDDGELIWEGKEYNCEYSDLPWEIEAYQFENSLELF